MSNLRYGHRKALELRSPETPELRSEHEHKKSVPKFLGLLVPVGCTRCRASTSGLSSRSSGRGPSGQPCGRSHLATSFALDAFQRLSLRRWRMGRAVDRTTRTPEPRPPGIRTQGQPSSDLLRLRRIGTDTSVTAEGSDASPAARSFLVPPGSACRHAGRTISSPASCPYSAYGLWDLAYHSSLRYRPPPFMLTARARSRWNPSSERCSRFSIAVTDHGEGLELEALLAEDGVGSKERNNLFHRKIVAAPYHIQQSDLSRPAHRAAESGPADIRGSKPLRGLDTGYGARETCGRVPLDRDVEASFPVDVSAGSRPSLFLLIVRRDHSDHHLSDCHLRCRPNASARV